MMTIVEGKMPYILKDTAANWTSDNPTLPAGIMGFETDTGRFKIGDGSTAWNSLEYNNTFSKTIIVAKDDTGDAATIGAAITKASELSPTSSNPVVILIMPGVYDETALVIPSYVGLVGMGPPQAVRIESDGAGGSDNRSIVAFSSNSWISNLSISTLDGGGWCTAVNTGGDISGVRVYNCHFYSEHDWMRSKEYSGGFPAQRDVSDFKVFNSTFNGKYDGIMLSGEYEFFSCDFFLQAGDTEDPRVACVFPHDAAATGSFFSSNFYAEITAGSNDAFVIKCPGNGSTINLYNCRMVAKSHDGNSYGICGDNSTPDTVNVYGGSLECSEDGSGSAYYADFAGIGPSGDGVYFCGAGGRGAAGGPGDGDYSGRFGTDGG